MNYLGNPDKGYVFLGYNKNVAAVESISISACSVLIDRNSSKRIWFLWPQLVSSHRVLACQMAGGLQIVASSSVGKWEENIIQADDTSLNRPVWWEVIYYIYSV